MDVTQTEEVAHESSYADRIETAKAEAKKKIFKKREQKPEGYTMKDHERKVAQATIDLLQHEGFKLLQEYESFIVAEQQCKAFEPPPPIWFTSEIFGEQMAFKKGLIQGLQLQKLQRERLWQTLLAEQEKQNKEKQNG